MGVTNGPSSNGGGYRAPSSDMRERDRAPSYSSVPGMDRAYRGPSGNASPVVERFTRSPAMIDTSGMDNFSRGMASSNSPIVERFTRASSRNNTPGLDRFSRVGTASSNSVEMDNYRGVAAARTPSPGMDRYSRAAPSSIHAPTDSYSRPPVAARDPLGMDRYFQSSDTEVPSPVRDAFGRGAAAPAGSAVDHYSRTATPSRDTYAGDSRQYQSGADFGADRHRRAPLPPVASPGSDNYSRVSTAIGTDTNRNSRAPPNASSGVDKFSRPMASGHASGTDYFSRSSANTSAAATPQRGASPDNGPFGDANNRNTRVNPFASPYHSASQSRVPSTYHSRAPSLTGSGTHRGLPPQRFFHSRRVKKGEVEKPWLTKKDPREKWVTIIPVIGLILGLGLAGFLVWDGLRSVVNHQYKLVLNEDFSSGTLDPNIWTKEAEVGGFGNGQFEETTVTDENVFIKDGQLWIQPTLQDAKLIEQENVINLTDTGICSSTVWSNCITSTNLTNGSIVNPVKSGRINTKKGATIKYGRVEVEAKLPAGDWLWPAIWMLPVNATYGDWPRSGEIDIAESRGNNYTYGQGGNNIISSTLHWGPNPANDGWWRTNVKRKALLSTFNDNFHTFGLEWSEKYLFTYVDSRLQQVLYTNFDKPLYQRGNFPLATANGTRLEDPWAGTGELATPFDQDFYLILNVGVGSTNKWFMDGQGGKPWVDDSPTARSEFWNARNQWFPTWEKNGQMIIKSVKMYQQID